jgi:hypothetical protein
VTHRAAASEEKGGLATHRAPSESAYVTDLSRPQLIRGGDGDGDAGAAVVLAPRGPVAPSLRQTQLESEGYPAHPADSCIRQ